MRWVTGILCGIVLCAAAGCLIEEKPTVDLAEKAAEIESARALALTKWDEGDFAGVVSTCKRGLGSVRTYRRNARHDDELWDFVAHRAYVLERLKTKATGKVGPAEGDAPVAPPDGEGAAVAGAEGEGAPDAGAEIEGKPDLDAGGEGEAAAGTGGEEPPEPEGGTPAAGAEGEVAPPEDAGDETATPPAGGTGEPERKHVPDGI
jgi:hypothetical protein